MRIIVTFYLLFITKSVISQEDWIDSLVLNNDSVEWCTVWSRKEKKGVSGIFRFYKVYVNDKPNIELPLNEVSFAYWKEALADSTKDFAATLYLYDILALDGMIFTSFKREMWEQQDNREQHTTYVLRILRQRIDSAPSVVK